MKSRGQESFTHLPAFAARLYNSLNQTKAIKQQHQEVALDLVSRIEGGKLLDIGTGPGKLLTEVYNLNPEIKLYGLDISEAMVRLARNNLAGIDADIRCGDIRRSSYDNDFFDIVTCTGSFYLWDNPEECLEEVYRILKKGHSAYLYETYQDYDEILMRKALKDNLKRENLVRKLLTPVFLMKQLRMTYRSAEVANLVRQTRFSEHFHVEQIILGGLPAWLRIQLIKCA